MRLFFLCGVLGLTIGVLLSCFCSWLSGFNFDKRGQEAVGVFICSLFSGTVGAAVGCMIASLVNSADFIRRNSP